MMTYERQAITSTARLPRHPGPHATVVKCDGRAGKCGQTIGVVDAGLLFVRHEGREMVSGLPCHVRCDRCGHWQMVEQGGVEPPTSLGTVR